MSTTSADVRKLSVLVVDDEQLVADSLVDILKMVGHEASSLYSGSDAIEKAAEVPFDVLISDVVMGEISGIDAAIEICKLLPNCKVLLVSGNNRTADLLKRAEEQGHNLDVLAKPVHPSVIIEWLRKVSLPN